MLNVTLSNFFSFIPYQQPLGSKYTGPLFTDEVPGALRV